MISSLWYYDVQPLVLCYPAFCTIDHIYLYEVREKLNNISYDVQMCTSKHVIEAIIKLKRNKASGPDGVASEHYIYSGGRISTKLSLFYPLPMYIVFAE